MKKSSNRNWWKQHYHPILTQDKINENSIQEIAAKLKLKESKNPLISLVIIAYNEETRILRCLSSIASFQTDIPMEVIVVNNNSKDNTQMVLDRCGVRSVLETKQGVGFARQAGMMAARGKYIACGDADTLYPPKYIDSLVKHLEKEDTAGVYGSYSFLPDGKKSERSLKFYEIFRDFAVSLRSINRPELCVGGANFAFRKEFGNAVGWRTDIKRGEDGSMAMGLKNFGKLRFISHKNSRAWTSSRTLDADGNITQMVMKRIVRELKRIKEYFSSKESYADQDYNMI
ncbi:MAG: glycosyltransferase [Bacteroidales bacterium]|nr:glycosyltransferase [Bacteroidales bacterium]MCF8391516.1 glycosyltransferase [Bacteroidales bacterium]